MQEEASSDDSRTLKQDSYLPAATSSTITAANHAVEKELAMLEKKKRTRRKYPTYMDETRAKIGCHTAENGNKAAAQKLSKSLCRPVNESTV